MLISIDQAHSYYQDAASAHDFDHVLRVLTLAQRLARAEGADEEIVHAAVLLHDMARVDEDLHSAGDHAQLAAERARIILIERGATADQADAVAHAIATHRFRGNTIPQTLEAKIVFDADKLDSIGAIGVARAYAVCGELNQRLWSETPPDGEANREQHNSDHTPVAEFAVKLSKIRDRLFTQTARQIAEERHRYMADFFARLESEVRGED